MSSPWYHCYSSAKRFGGKPEDYFAIHEWFDTSKRAFADYRHRALRHHWEGIFECVQYFGDTITVSNGAKIPTRLIGQQHVVEDLQWIPSLKDWLKTIQPHPWMEMKTNCRIQQKFSINIANLEIQPILDAAPDTTPSQPPEVTTWQHCCASAKRFGGKPEDYLKIHEWFDADKQTIPDYRHRALRHHSEGIFECALYFGNTVTISTGAKIPIRLIGEQHVTEDLHWIPSLKDWLKTIQPQPWMKRNAKLLFRKSHPLL